MSPCLQWTNSAAFVISSLKSQKPRLLLSLRPAIKSLHQPSNLPQIQLAPLGALMHLASELVENEKRLLAGHVVVAPGGCEGEGTIEEIMQAMEDFQAGRF